MPERFLIQILRRLVKHGLLCSTCGVAGGYYLARSPRLISLRDVFDAIESAAPRRPQEFDFVSRTANERVAETLLAAENAARFEFQKVTLASLLGESGNVEHHPHWLKLPQPNVQTNEESPTH
jgi:DNA-binding IscR family transcriptional regulator